MRGVRSSSRPFPYFGGRKISPGSSTAFPEMVAPVSEIERMISAPRMPRCAPSRAATSDALGESPTTARVACSLAALRVSRNTLYMFLRPIAIRPPYGSGHATLPADGTKLIIGPFKIYYVEATGGFQPGVFGVDFAATTRPAGHRGGTGALRGRPGDRYAGVERGSRPPAR